MRSIFLAYFHKKERRPYKISPSDTDYICSDTMQCGVIFDKLLLCSLRQGLGNGLTQFLSLFQLKIMPLNQLFSLL